MVNKECLDMMETLIYREPDSSLVDFPYQLIIKNMQFCSDINDNDTKIPTFILPQLLYPQSVHVTLDYFENRMTMTSPEL